LVAPFPWTATSLPPERLHQLCHFDGYAAVSYPGHRFLLLTFIFFWTNKKDRADPGRTIL
jgi:hypothetical protein